MTRARDVANVLSTATSLATDSETAAAISSHATAANGHVGRGNTASRPGSPTVGDLYFDTTLDALIQYKSTGWAAIAPVPDAPTNVSATGGDAQATVSFTAPTNVPVTSYTVTSSPGNITASGASSPITVTGLTNGTAYTFTVTALGSNGSSAASSASNSVTLVAPIVIDYLVVAGGGATFYDGITDRAWVGGGGAGGYRSSLSGSANMNLVSGTSYTVTVGAGGAKNNTTVAKGSNSSIIGGAISFSATGGGGSLMSNGAGNANGGSSSGGVGGPGGAVTFTGNEGGYSPVEGYSGGAGGTTYGGGGGGSSGNGTSGATGQSAAGGAGTSNSISGSAVTYAAGGRGGNGGFLDASANTGNGGGSGGNGGSGVVIIRALQAAASTTGSPVATTSGSYHIYQFNNSGSITF